MTELSTSMSGLSFASPDPARDAVFAYGWFSSKDGRDTLLKMGNTLENIRKSTLAGERSTIEEFLEVERQGKQKTWMIQYGDVTIGAAWIDLVEKNGVKPPSVHLMIGDSAYRNKGIGKATMIAMIDYLKTTGTKDVYSRHLASNEAVTALNRSLGFLADGKTYIDDNGLEWQNIKLSILSAFV